MNQIQKVQVKALDQIGTILADLTFETNPVSIEVKLGLLATTARIHYEMAKNLNLKEAV